MRLRRASARRYREYQRVVGASGVLSLADRREYVDERLRHITPRILTVDDRARALGLFDNLAADVSPAVQPLVSAPTSARAIFS